MRLARRDSRADLSEYLWYEVQEHFGLDPVRCGTDGFADRLLAWYAGQQGFLTVSSSASYRARPCLRMGFQCWGNRRFQLAPEGGYGGTGTLLWLGDGGGGVVRRAGAEQRPGELAAGIEQPVQGGAHVGVGNP